MARADLGMSRPDLVSPGRDRRAGLFVRLADHADHLPMCRKAIMGLRGCGSGGRPRRGGALCGARPSHSGSRSTPRICTRFFCGLQPSRPIMAIRPRPSLQAGVGEQHRHELVAVLAADFGQHDAPVPCRWIRRPPSSAEHELLEVLLLRDFLLAARVCRLVRSRSRHLRGGDASGVLDDRAIGQRASSSIFQRARRHQAAAA